MKKEMRMFAGILLHPVKKIFRLTYRKSENDILLSRARRRQWEKNHERMHEMARLTNKSWTSSPLCDNLYFGAPEVR